MRRGQNIKIVLEKKRTASENVEDYGNFIETSDLPRDENIGFEELIEDVISVKTEETNLKPPKISVFDVAAYILQEKESLTTIKLQKLVYYCQAWSLVWDKKSLFEEPIEAWTNGPVVRKLFDFHRGRYELDAIPIGNPELLTEEQQETIDTVLGYYSRRSAECLIEMTHREDPWQNARSGLQPLESGNVVITLEDIAEYYSALLINIDAPHPGITVSHKIAVAPPGFALQSKGRSD